MNKPNQAPAPTGFLPEGLRTAVKLGVRGTLALGAIGFIGWAIAGGGAESIGAEAYNIWHGANSYKPTEPVPSSEAALIHQAQQTIAHNEQSHRLPPLNGENPDLP